jgi:hypothetical protein
MADQTIGFSQPRFGGKKDQGRFLHAQGDADGMSLLFLRGLDSLSALVSTRMGVRW